MIAFVSTKSEAIKSMIAAEIADFDPVEEARKASRTDSGIRSGWYAQTLDDFRDAVIEPQPEKVLFSGGFEQECWQVTRGNGPYHVIYIPSANYFALAVETMFGPADIGVHGGAIQVFGSV